MAERLGEALLDLDTNDKAFRKGVDRAERSAKGLGTTFDLTSAKARQIGAALAAAAAVGATAMAVLIKRSIDSADNFAKMSQRVGVSVEDLSSLSHAAKLSDVSLENLGTSMGFLSRAMNEFSRGTENNATKALKQLGISVVDVDGKLRSNIDVLGEIADRFAGMENGAQKTALAMEVFGRSGATLIPLLNEGASGIAELRAEADRLGITISTETAKAAEEFNDNLTRLEAAMQGLANKVTAAALPALVDFSEWLAGLDPTVVAVGGSLLTAAAAVTGLGFAAKGAAGGVAALAASVGVLASGLAALAAIPGAMALLAGGIVLGSTTEAGGNSEKEFEREFNKRLDEEKAKLELVESLRASLADPPEVSASDLYGGFTFGDDGKIRLVTDALKGLTDETSGAADEAKRHGQAVRDLIAELEFERQIVGLSARDQEVLNTIRYAGVGVMSEEGLKIRALITETEEHRDQLEQMEEVYGLLGDVGRTAIMGLVDAMMDGQIEGEELLSILGSVLSMAGSFFLDQGFGGGGGGGGGLGGVLGDLFSGFFADGGLIPNGSFGIVGEEGPEPVIGTPRGAQVLPNSSLADMMGGGGMVNHITVNGSNLSQAELTQAIGDAIDRFDRHRLPSRVAAINADPLARG